MKELLEEILKDLRIETERLFKDENGIEIRFDIAPVVKYIYKFAKRNNIELK